MPAATAGTCPHGQPAGLLHPPRRRRPATRSAAVPGLLRPRPPGRLELSRGRAVAAHQHAIERHLAAALPPTRHPPRPGRHRLRPNPPGASGAGVARQGRRDAAPRRRPLPRPAPPRRLDPADPARPGAPAGRHHRRRPGRRRQHAATRQITVHHPAAPRPARTAGRSPGASRSTYAPSASATATSPTPRSPPTWPSTPPSPPRSPATLHPAHPGHRRRLRRPGRQPPRPPHRRLLATRPPHRTRHPDSREDRRPSRRP